MTRRLLPPADLGWVLAGSLLGLGTALLGISWSPWRIAIGLLATLVLPGYALAAAAFAPRPIRAADGLVLTLGLSLVAGCLALLVMIILGIRITEDAWSVLVFALTASAAVAAAARSDERPRLRLPHLEWLEAGAGLIAMLMLAAAIATAGVVIARNGTNDDHGPGFTELSLVPSGSGAAAVVTARSFEHSATTFRLSVTPALPSLSSASFTLGPGRSWQDTVAIPESLRGYRIGITLYRAGDAKPYRFVFIGGARGRIRRP